MSAPSTDVLYGRVLGKILEERGISVKQFSRAAAVDTAALIAGGGWSLLAWSEVVLELGDSEFQDRLCAEMAELEAEQEMGS